MNFLTQAVANNGFPFEIKRNSTNNSSFNFMSEDEILEKLSEAREQSAQGRQREVKSVISDMQTDFK